MIGYDGALAQAWLEAHAGLKGLYGGGLLVCQIGTGLPLRYEYPNPALEGMEATRRFFAAVREGDMALAEAEDPWKHRSKEMKCRTCMFYVVKAALSKVAPAPATTYAQPVPAEVGRCRRHAPTMAGYPAVFPDDWCGDHKIDETKINRGGA